VMIWVVNIGRLPPWFWLSMICSDLSVLFCKTGVLIVHVHGSQAVDLLTSNRIASTP
jgi:hypothetical protein